MALITSPVISNTTLYSVKYGATGIWNTFKGINVKDSNFSIVSKSDPLLEITNISILKSEFSTEGVEISTIGCYISYGSPGAGASSGTADFIIKVRQLSGVSKDFKMTVQFVEKANTAPVANNPTIQKTCLINGDFTFNTSDVINVTGSSALIIDNSSKYLNTRRTGLNSYRAWAGESGEYYSNLKWWKADGTTSGDFVGSIIVNASGNAATTTINDTITIKFGKTIFHEINYTGRAPTTLGFSNLPEGLSLLKLGYKYFILGSIISLGSFNYLASGYGNTGSISITVQPSPPVFFETPSSVEILLNSPLSWTPLVLNEDRTKYEENITFTAQNLPTGFTINSTTGEITGTSSVTAVASVTVTATGGGGSSTITFSLVIGQVEIPGLTSVFNLNDYQTNQIIDNLYPTRPVTVSGASILDPRPKFDETCYFFPNIRTTEDTLPNNSSPHFLRVQPTATGELNVEDRDFIVEAWIKLTDLPVNNTIYSSGGKIANEKNTYPIFSVSGGSTVINFNTINYPPFSLFITETQIVAMGGELFPTSGNGTGDRLIFAAASHNNAMLNNWAHVAFIRRSTINQSLGYNAGGKSFYTLLINGVVKAAVETSLGKIAYLPPTRGFYIGLKSNGNSTSGDGMNEFLSFLENTNLSSLTSSSISWDAFKGYMQGFRFLSAPVNEGRLDHIYPNRSLNAINQIPTSLHTPTSVSGYKKCLGTPVSEGKCISPIGDYDANIDDRQDKFLSAPYTVGSLASTYSAPSFIHFPVNDLTNSSEFANDALLAPVTIEGWFRILTNSVKPSTSQGACLLTIADSSNFVSTACLNTTWDTRNGITVRDVAAARLTANNGLPSTARKRSISPYEWFYLSISIPIFIRGASLTAYLHLNGELLGKATNFVLASSFPGSNDWAAKSSQAWRVLIGGGDFTFGASAGTNRQWVEFYDFKFSYGIGRYNDNSYTPPTRQEAQVLDEYVHWFVDGSTVPQNDPVVADRGKFIWKRNKAGVLSQGVCTTPSPGGTGYMQGITPVASTFKNYTAATNIPPSSNNFTNLLINFDTYDNKLRPIDSSINNHPIAVKYPGLSLVASTDFNDTSVSRFSGVVNGQIVPQGALYISSLDSNVEINLGAGQEYEMILSGTNDFTLHFWFLWTRDAIQPRLVGSSWVYDATIFNLGNCIELRSGWDSSATAPSYPNTNLNLYIGNNGNYTVSGGLNSTAGFLGTYGLGTADPLSSASRSYTSTDIPKTIPQPPIPINLGGGTVGNIIKGALLQGATTFTSFSGATITNTALASLLSGITTFDTFTGTRVTGTATYIVTHVAGNGNTAGFGAVLSITTTGTGTNYTTGTGGNTTITVVSGGTGYAVGTTITIPGPSLGGAPGTTTNNFTFTIRTAVGYANVTQSSTSGTGTGAVLTVARTAPSTGTYATGNTAITIVNPGNGYAIGDTITIPGEVLGGVTPTNNLTFSIATALGEPWSATITGMTSGSTLSTFLGNTPSPLAIGSLLPSTTFTIATTAASGTNVAGTATGSLLQGITTFTTFLGTNVPGAATGGLLEGFTVFGGFSGTSIPNAGTYTGVTQSSSSGTGSGAVFNITKTGTGTAYTTYNTTITVVSPGNNYTIGNTITIPGTSLGGTAANNFTFTIFSAVGYTGVQQLDGTAGGTSTPTTKATFTIVKRNTATSTPYSTTNTTIVVTSPGAGYQLGSTIILPGPSLGGAPGTTTNNFTFTVATSVGYIGVTQSRTSGAGTGATFLVQKRATGALYGTSGVTTVTLINGGSGYAIGDTITIPGNQLGGATPLNNFTFTVATAVGATNVSQISTTKADGITPGTGTGATFNITRTTTGATYTTTNTTITVVNQGSGYGIGDIVKLPGTSLGGFLPLTASEQQQAFGLSGAAQNSPAGSLLNNRTTFTRAGTSVSATGTYTVNVAGGAQLIIEKTDTGTNYSFVNIIIIAGGSGYTRGGTIVIPGDQLGAPAGSTTNNLTLTIGGTIGHPNIDSTKYTVTKSDGVTPGTGTGAVFTVERTAIGTTYSTTNTAITVTSSGTGFEVGDRIRILGGNLGGTNGTHDLTLTVLSYDFTFVFSVAPNNIISATNGTTASIYRGNGIATVTKVDSNSALTYTVTSSPSAASPDLATTPVAGAITNIVVWKNDGPKGYIREITGSLTGATFGSISGTGIGAANSPGRGGLLDGITTFTASGTPPNIAYGSLIPSASSPTPTVTQSYQGNNNRSDKGGLLEGITKFDTISGRSISAMGVYANVTQKSTSGTGSGAVFTITKTDTLSTYTYIIITITTPGDNYAVGNTITIAGDSLGGISPYNDLTFTIRGCNCASLYPYTSTGLTSGGVGYAGLTQKSTSGSGSGAVFTVVKFGPGTGLVGYIGPTDQGASQANMNTVVLITEGGNNYSDGEQITISAANIGEADIASNDLKFTITGAYNSNYTSYLSGVVVNKGITITPTQTNGAGSEAVMDLERWDGGWYWNHTSWLNLVRPRIKNPGKNYKVGDTIKLLGNQLDLPPLASSNEGRDYLSGRGQVSRTRFNLSGNAIPAGCSGCVNEYFNVTQDNTKSNTQGRDAVFEVLQFGTTTTYNTNVHVYGLPYRNTMVTIVNPGNGLYKAGDTIVIPGEQLGGTPGDSTYDMTMTIVNVDLTLTIGTAVGFANVTQISTTKADGITPGTGTGAVFTVRRNSTNGPAYTASNTTITATGGSGYAIGDIIKISGDKLGGLTPDNDLIFSVTAIASGGPDYKLKVVDLSSITGFAPGDEVIATTGTGALTVSTFRTFVESIDSPTNITFNLLNATSAPRVGTIFDIVKLANTTSNILIPTADAVNNLTISLNITHPTRADLIVELLSPSGTVHILSNRTAGTNYTLTNSAIAAFYGEQLAGTWTLRIRDYVGNTSTGTLNSWSLSNTQVYPNTFLSTGTKARWRHFALIRKNGIFRAFVDGLERVAYLSSLQLSPSAISPSTVPTVKFGGGRTVTGDNPVPSFSGMIDEFTFLNTGDHFTPTIVNGLNRITVPTTEYKPSGAPFVSPVILSGQKIDVFPDTYFSFTPQVSLLEGNETFSIEFVGPVAGDREEYTVQVNSTTGEISGKFIAGIPKSVPIKYIITKNNLIFSSIITINIRVPYNLLQGPVLNYSDLISNNSDILYLKAVSKILINAKGKLYLYDLVNNTIKLCSFTNFPSRGGTLNNFQSIDGQLPEFGQFLEDYNAYSWAASGTTLYVSIRTTSLVNDNVQQYKLYFADINSLSSTTAFSPAPPTFTLNCNNLHNADPTSDEVYFKNGTSDLLYKFTSILNWEIVANIKNLKQLKYFTTADYVKQAKNKLAYTFNLSNQHYQIFSDFSGKNTNKTIFSSESLTDYYSGSIIENIGATYVRKTGGKYWHHLTPVVSSGIYSDINNEITKADLFKYGGSYLILFNDEEAFKYYLDGSNYRNILNSNVGALWGPNNTDTDLEIKAVLPRVSDITNSLRYRPISLAVHRKFASNDTFNVVVLADYADGDNSTSTAKPPITILSGEFKVLNSIIWKNIYRSSETEAAYINSSEKTKVVYNGVTLGYVPLSDTEQANKFIFTRDGYNWQHTSIPQSIYKTLAISDQNTVLILSNVGGAGTTNTSFLRSLDEGRTFETISWNVDFISTTTTYTILDVEYGGGKWIATTSSPGVNIISTDNGASWTRVTGLNFLTSAVRKIKYINGRWVALASTNGVVCYYSLDGIAWTTMPTTRVQDSSLRWTDVVFHNNFYIFYSSPPNKQILKTNNLSTYTVTLELSTIAPFSNILVGDDNILYGFCSNNTNIYYTSINNGDTWVAKTITIYGETSTELSNIFNGAAVKAFNDLIYIFPYNTSTQSVLINRSYIEPFTLFKVREIPIYGAPYRDYSLGKVGLSPIVLEKSSQIVLLNDSAGPQIIKYLPYGENTIFTLDPTAQDLLRDGTHFPKKVQIKNPNIAQSDIVIGANAPFGTGLINLAGDDPYPSQYFNSKNVSFFEENSSYIIREKSKVTACDYTGDYPSDFIFGSDPFTMEGWFYIDDFNNLGVPKSTMPAMPSSHVFFYGEKFFNTKKDAFGEATNPVQYVIRLYCRYPSNVTYTFDSTRTEYNMYLYVVACSASAEQIIYNDIRITQNGTIKSWENTWKHVALVKSLDGRIDIFVDGQCITSSLTAPPVTNYYFPVEFDIEVGNLFHRVSDIKITKQALYNRNQQNSYNKPISGGPLTPKYSQFRRNYQTSNQKILTFDLVGNMSDVTNVTWAAPTVSGLSGDSTWTVNSTVTSKPTLTLWNSTVVGAQTLWTVNIDGQTYSFELPFSFYSLNLNTSVDSTSLNGVSLAPPYYSAIISKSTPWVNSTAPIEVEIPVVIPAFNTTVEIINYRNPYGLIPKNVEFLRNFVNGAVSKTSGTLRFILDKGTGLTEYFHLDLILRHYLGGFTACSPQSIVHRQYSIRYQVPLAVSLPTLSDLTFLINTPITPIVISMQGDVANYGKNLEVYSLPQGLSVTYSEPIGNSGFKTATITGQLSASSTVSVKAVDIYDNAEQKTFNVFINPGFTFAPINNISREVLVDIVIQLNVVLEPGVYITDVTFSGFPQTETGYPIQLNLQTFAITGRFQFNINVFECSVTLTSNIGGVVTRSFTLNTFTTAPIVVPTDKTVIVGLAITPIQIEVLDESNLQSLSVTGVPLFLTYNETTRQISGTIYQPSVSEITITTTALGGGVVVVKFKITAILDLDLTEASKNITLYLEKEINPPIQIGVVGQTPCLGITINVPAIANPAIQFPRFVEFDSASRTITGKSIEFHDVKNIQFLLQYSPYSFIAPLLKTVSVNTSLDLSLLINGTTDIPEYFRYDIYKSQLPTLRVAGEFLSFLNTIEGSFVQTQIFNVGGENLAGDVIITASANFQISINNITFSAALNLPNSSGFLADTTIYVRLNPALAIGNYSGNITVATINYSPDKVFSVTGEVVQTAELAAGLSLFDRDQIFSIFDLEEERDALIWPAMEAAMDRWDELIRVNPSIYRKVRKILPLYNGIVIDDWRWMTTTAGAAGQGGPTNTLEIDGKYIPVGFAQYLNGLIISDNLEAIANGVSTIAEVQSYWEIVITHELGHGFGIGTLWYYDHMPPVDTVGYYLVEDLNNPKYQNALGAYRDYCNPYRDLAGTESPSDKPSTVLTISDTNLELEGQQIQIGIGGQVQITATIVDGSLSAVTEVQFFKNGLSIPTLSSSARTITFLAEEIGVFYFKARIKDDEDNIVFSGVKPLIVTDGTTSLPSINSFTLSSNSVQLGQNVTLTTTVNNGSLNIARVRFLINYSLLTSINAPGPYTFVFTPTETGLFEFLVEVVDTAGNVGISTIKSLAVTTGVPPTITLSTDSLATKDIRKPINFIASVTNGSGNIVKVEFFADGGLLSSINAPGPYIVNNYVLNVVGNVVFTARVVDDLGNVIESNSININNYPVEINRIPILRPDPPSAQFSTARKFGAGSHWEYEPIIYNGVELVGVEGEVMSYGPSGANPVLSALTIGTIIDVSHYESKKMAGEDIGEGDPIINRFLTSRTSSHTDSNENSFTCGTCSQNTLESKVYVTKAVEDQFNFYTYTVLKNPTELNSSDNTETTSLRLGEDIVFSTNNQSIDPIIITVAGGNAETVTDISVVGLDGSGLVFNFNAVNISGTISGVPSYAGTYDVYVKASISTKYFIEENFKIIIVNNDFDLVVPNVVGANVKFEGKVAINGNVYSRLTISEIYSGVFARNMWIYGINLYTGSRISYFNAGTTPLLTTYNIIPNQINFGLDSYEIKGKAPTYPVSTQLSPVEIISVGATTLTWNNLPPGITYNSTTEMLEGACNEIGAWNTTVTATNSLGKTITLPNYATFKFQAVFNIWRRANLIEMTVIGGSPRKIELGTILNVEMLRDYLKVMTYNSARGYSGSYILDGENLEFPENLPLGVPLIVTATPPPLFTIAPNFDFYFISGQEMKMLGRGISGSTFLPKTVGGEEITHWITPINAPQGIVQNSTTGVFSGYATLPSPINTETNEPTTDYMVVGACINSFCIYTEIAWKIEFLQVSIIESQTFIVLLNDQAYINILYSPQGDKPASWSYTGALPAGLVFNTENGRITGITTANKGTYVIMVTGHHVEGYEEFDSTPTAVTIEIVGAGYIAIAPSLTAALLVSNPIQINTLFLAGETPTEWEIYDNGTITPWNQGTFTIDNSGVITGTPEAVGTYRFGVRGKIVDTNRELYSNVCRVIIDVYIPGYSVNMAPNLSNSTISALNNVAFTSTVVNSGGNINSITIVGNPVTGVTAQLDAQNKNITISGTIATVGTYTLTISATNLYGTAQVVVTINVTDGRATIASNQQFFLEKGKLLVGTEVLQITGPAATSVNFTTLPAGLTYNVTTRVFGGTPTGNSGVFDVTATATNASGTSNPTTIQFSISDAKVEIGNGQRIEVIQNEQFSEIITTTGAISGGSINTTLTGVDLSISGDPKVARLTGLVAAPGTYSVFVTLNNFGSSDTELVQLVVLPKGIVIPDTLSFTGTVGTYFEQSITATSGTPNGWNTTANAIFPPGVTFSFISGRFTGTPRTPGVYIIEVFALNSFVNSNICTVTITITSASTPPIIDSNQEFNILNNTQYNDLTVTYTGGEPTNWNAVDLPAGLVINQSTGKIYGFVTQSAGTFSSIITARNSSGNSRKSVTFIVSNFGEVAIPASQEFQFVLDQPITTNNQLNYTGLNVIISSVTPMPSGLSITSNGLLQGTPRAAGVYSVTLRASNNVSQVTATISIAITRALLPPVLAESLTPITLTRNVMMSPYNFVNSGGTASSWSAVNIPAGLSFNSLTGTISGRPTATGNDTVTVTAINSAGTDSTTLGITVVSNLTSPTIENQTVSANINSNLSRQLIATGTVATWSIVGQSLNWINLNSVTGVLSGVPNQLGSFNIVVKVANSAGFDEATITVNVTSNLTVPVIRTGQSVSRTKGVNFSYRISLASNSDPATNWRVKTGETLPPGLSLDPDNGYISGTPTLAGSTTTQIIASNSAGESTPQGVNIVITESVGAVPVITENQVFSATVNTQFSRNILYSGNVTEWRIVSGTLPNGLTLNGASGNISGIPASYTAPNTVRIFAGNSNGSDEKNITIGVNAALIKISPNQVLSGFAGDNFNQNIQFQGVVTEWTSNLPNNLGLTLSNTGTILGIPATEGEFNIIVTATHTPSGTNANGVIKLIIQSKIPKIIAGQTISAATNNYLSYGIAHIVLGGAGVTKWSMLTTLPQGLTLNSTTGIIQGTPTQATAGNYIVKAENSYGSSTGSINITIASIAGLLKINPEQTFIAQANTYFEFTPVYVGIPTNWYILEPLAGVTINNTTGKISGTLAAGNYRICVYCENARFDASAFINIVVS